MFVGEPDLLSSLSWERLPRMCNREQARLGLWFEPGLRPNVGRVSLSRPAVGCVLWRAMQKNGSVNSGVEATSSRVGVIAVTPPFFFFFFFLYQAEVVECTALVYTQRL